MEGQTQNQQKPAIDETRPVRNPAIRTMRSDVQELFKTTKPSLIQIIGKEAEASKEVYRSENKRNYKTLAITAGALAFLASVAGVFFFLYPFRASDEEIIPAKPMLPLPYFAVETARTISMGAKDRALFLRLFTDSYKEQERDGQVKRIVIKLQEGERERFADLHDFFEFYKITPEKNFLGRLSPPLMVFIYYGGDGNRIGLIIKTNNPDRTLADMLAWESSILSDFRPLFFDEKPETSIIPFEDRIYRNIDWRYQKIFDGKDLGIAYALFPAKNLLIITTGKEAMETVINRLFDAR